MTDEELRQAKEAMDNFKRDFFLHSDRAAIDVGIAGLNAITLLNGGAIVALLAFVGQVWNDGKGAIIVKAIIHSGTFFSWGLLASATNFFIAYFYQSSLTWITSLHLGDYPTDPNVEQFKRRANASALIWKYPMVLLALASVGLFLFGVFEVSNAFLNFTAAK